MFKLHLLICTILLAVGCTSAPNDLAPLPTVSKVTNSKQITLSHVRAYLQIGKAKRAQALFETIANENLGAEMVLTAIELKAALGDPIGAQQAFISALTNKQLTQLPVPPTLIDFFCQQKKWGALETYGKNIHSLDLSKEDKTKQLIPIALCFYQQEKWEKTKFWLAQLDLNAPLPTEIYLALAKVYIDARQFSLAKQYIEKFDREKQQVSPHTLWTAIEVFQALGQAGKALQLEDNLRLLFPTWQRPITGAFTRQSTLSKENLHSDIEQVPQPKTLTSESKAQVQKELKIHIIQKGETLYRISKTYKVSITDLKRWNPSLVINDIPLGTPIYLSEH